MKYCYRCGTQYEGSECPLCYTDLYTEKPNSRTQKTSSEAKCENTNDCLIDLFKETKRLE